MRFVIDPEDDRGFRAANRELLDSFAGSLRDVPDVTPDEVDEAVADVGLALQWKWGYADGALTRWRPDELAEFLFEWCPRKLSADPEECRTIPSSLAAFVEHLEEVGLLDRRSAPADLVASGMEAVTDEFVEAMADRSRFGMAKSLVAAAGTDGVDGSDPDQLGVWIEQFNELPDEERRQLLPGPPFGAPTVPWKLPPVALPGEAAVAASQDAAPVLVLLRDLAQFVGSGRKLTQKGNLTLADARALVELLGTGDALETVYGDHTYRTTTSEDLGGLRLVVRWAKKAGVVRVLHGKLVATKRGLGMADDVAGWFDRAVDALFEEGPLAMGRHPRSWEAFRQIDRMIDGLSLQLLLPPYIAQDEVELADIGSVVEEEVFDAFVLDWDDGAVRGVVERSVAEAVDTFELAGLVVRAGTTPEEFGSPSGGSVALTPAGIDLVRRRFAALGFATPDASRYVAATAEEMLEGVAADLDGSDEAYQTGIAEATAWRQARPPEQAATELASAVRAVGRPPAPNLGMALLTDLGPDVAGPHLRALAEDGVCRGLALGWLVDHGMADESQLFRPDDVTSFVEVLEYRMADGGPDRLVATLALAGDHDAQSAAVAGLWNAPSEATELVLEALAEVHPIRAVAKSARRSLFKRRSSWTTP